MDEFTKILPGELIWKPGYCGIYIGNDVDLHLDKNSSPDPDNDDCALKTRNQLFRLIGVCGDKSEQFSERLREYRKLLREAS